jgi:amidase
VVTALLLLLASSVTAPPAAMARGETSTTVAGIDIDATTIPELQALMNRNRLNSVQLTQFYLHRIKKLDPLLNAVITVSPTALADARAADKARRQGDRRPLLGMPIILKDNINTTGMATTAGSWSLAGSAPSDAFIVERLKAAGAIILGKANLSEWANFRSVPRRAAGAASAARRTWRTCSIAIRAGRAPARPSACPRAWPSRQSARRPMVRSCAPRARTPWSGSSRRSAC